MLARSDAACHARLALGSLQGPRRICRLPPVQLHWFLNESLCIYLVERQLEEDN